MYLQNTIKYSEICAGNQIKYSGTVASTFSKDNLFHKLMNYLKSSSDSIYISWS